MLLCVEVAIALVGKNMTIQKLLVTNLVYVVLIFVLVVVVAL